MRIYESEGGAPLQSGLRFVSDSHAPSCELVRGVVTAVYVYDDPSHPLAAFGPTAVFCDCLVYSSLPGSRIQPATNCLFMPSVSGIQSGVIRKPRATAGMVGGGTLDPQNPTQMDGDHVLLGFLDGRKTQPVILGFLPHPSADIGNEGAAIGHRQRLKVVDGDPHFIKHHGSFFGVADNGDLVLNASQGSGGALAQGQETPSGTANVRMIAASGGSVSMSLGGVASATAVLAGAGVFTLGDGSDAAALAKKVDAAFASLVASINALVLPVATAGVPPITTAGPSLTPLTPPLSVASTKLRIPSE